MTETSYVLFPYTVIVLHPEWTVSSLVTLSVSRRVNLPWLYYGDEPGLASRVLQTDPVPISFSFRGRNKVSDKL